MFVNGPRNDTKDAEQMAHASASMARKTLLKKSVNSLVLYSMPVLKSGHDARRQTMRQFLTTALTFFMLMLAGTAYAGDCMRLCDYNFWQRNGDGVPSIEDIQAEIDKGADPTARDRGKHTPLHWAAAYADSEQIMFLLQQGTDLEAKTGLHTTRTGKRTPLHYAVYLSSRKAENTAALIQAGANINVRDVSGYTPLMLAVERQNIDTVNLLLDAGANAQLRNRWKETAFDYARGNPDWIKHLSTYKRLKAASGE